LDQRRLTTLASLTLDASNELRNVDHADIRSCVAQYSSH
jgi:hypothetical protein